MKGRRILCHPILADLCPLALTLLSGRGSITDTCIVPQASQQKHYLLAFFYKGKNIGYPQYIGNDKHQEDNQHQLQPATASR